MHISRLFLISDFIQDLVLQEVHWIRGETVKVTHAETKKPGIQVITMDESHSQKIRDFILLTKFHDALWPFKGLALMSTRKIHKVSKTKPFDTDHWDPYRKKPYPPYERVVNPRN